MRFQVFQRPPGAALLLLMLAMIGGCTQSRTFTIYAVPAEARIVVDGVPRGPGPITQKFQFTGPNDLHHVRAIAPGYEARGEDVWPDTPSNSIVLKLRPLGKRMVFTVGPEPALVKVNGTPVTPALVDRAEYMFSADNPEAEYVVTAERDGYETARRTLTGADPPGYYPLIMKPGGAGPGPEAGPTVAMRPVEPGAAATQPQAHAEAPRPPVATPLKRDIVVQTDPPNVGATIYLGDEEWGRNGLDLAGHEFKRDRNGKPIPVPISAKAPGYEGGSAVMRWEDQRSQYVIPLGRRKKDVRIVTDPAGAVVTLDDKPLPRDRTGAATATILFPPTEEQGDAPTVYTARVAATSDAWEPQELKIGWEGGRREYRVKLAPARSAKATLLRPVLVWREGTGWRAEAKRVQTGAVRDIGEGRGQPEATRFAGAGAETVPDAISVSPDGSRVLCTMLSADGDDGSLKSTLRLFKADGTPGETPGAGGGSLDLTPAFTPDGARILFASDRGGRGGINVWSMPVTADPAAPDGGATQISTSSNATLWPTIDSNPPPRLFYEAVLKGAAGREAEGSEIHVVEMAAAPRTNMTLARGSHPRPSPRADSVVFTVADPATGNRDLYLVSDKDGVPLGGEPVNLTNTPDVDECDPAWSRNGARVAFASNAGADDAGRNNYDIYVMTMTGRDRRQTRVTFNGSWDDGPAWDPAGKMIYFRSNRGGQWGIWKIAAP